METTYNVSNAMESDAINNAKDLHLNLLKES